MNLLQLDPEDIHYQAIVKFYGDKKAERSGVPYINHINEGLKIMGELNYTFSAQRAFCLHPLFQGDAELGRAVWPDFDKFDRWVILLAMEYRNIANQYLSTRELAPTTVIQADGKVEIVGGWRSITLSPLFEVQQMLVADKLQNYKDFMKYHYLSHPRSKELWWYFWNWFERLELTDHEGLKPRYAPFVEGDFTA